MPPGMIMDRRHLGRSDARHGRRRPPRGQRRGPASRPRRSTPAAALVEGNVKVFDLTIAVTGWHILPDRRVEAYAVNGQVPGPRLRVTQGDRVRVNVRNNLPEPTSIHWHGLILPNAMDGAADITQPAIAARRARLTYEFTAPQQGSYFYHSHAAADRQQALGLYGALIVDPRTPPSTPPTTTTTRRSSNCRNGCTATGSPTRPCPWKAPCRTTSPSTARPTRTPKPSTCGSGERAPGAVHRHPQQLRAPDAHPRRPVPHRADRRRTRPARRAAAQGHRSTSGPANATTSSGKPTNPGKWLLHCHIPHHTTNDNAEEARRRRADGRHRRHRVRGGSTMADERT